MKISLEELRALFTRAIRHKGFPMEQAAKLARWLLWATIRGNVQDGRKISSLVYKPTAKIEVSRLSPACAVVNAHYHHPVLALELAVEVGLQMSREFGTALVAVTQTDQSSGAIGYFTHMVAEQGMIGELMSSTIPLVGPFDIAERLVGTNPYSAAFPGNPPVLVDASIAAISFYGVRVAESQRENLPPGVALDAFGEPTIDPQRVTLREGTLLSQGAFASGFGITIQLFAAEMFGEESWGHLLRVTNPAIFGARPDFAERFRLKFKSARRRSEAGENLLPGERGYRAMQAAQASGEAEIPTALYEQLTSLG